MLARMGNLGPDRQLGLFLMSPGHFHLNYTLLIATHTPLAEFLTTPLGSHVLNGVQSQDFRKAIAKPEF